jgi:hypothetical protein
LQPNFDLEVEALVELPFGRTDERTGILNRFKKVKNKLYAFRFFNVGIGGDAPR